MKELRFCFLTTFYPPYNFGGDGIAVQRLARALVRAGHRVTVVHDVDAWRLLGGRSDLPAGEDDGVEVISLRSRMGSLSPLLTQQFGIPVAHGRRIRRLIEERDADVVHFHNVSLVGGPALLRAGQNSIRLYTAHEHWLVCPMHVLWRHNREPCTGRECVRCTLAHRRPPQLYRVTGAMQRSFREVDTFIALSEFSRQKHAEFGFGPSMEVMPNLVPAPQGAPSAARTELPVHEETGRPFFLFAGRLERLKGLDEVIQVFERFPDVDLVIAGEGGHEAALQASPTPNSNVRFVGRVSSFALGQLYGRAAGLIAPSIGFETFGLILVEAMSHGTPVLARDSGPFPEIVNTSGAGLLFQDGDSLAAGIDALIDPQRHSDLSARALAAYATHWGEDVVLERYFEIIESTARQSGREELAVALGGAG